MTILDLLTAAAGAEFPLRAVLEAAKKEAPDLAPQIDAIETALDASVAPENLLALAAALPAELLDILKGHLAPTPHAGDAT